MLNNTELTTDSTDQQTTGVAAARPTGPRVMRRQDFTLLPGPPDAPFVRKQCFDDGHVWIGEVTTEPGTASPWHHHGNYDTFAYLLEGEAGLELADANLAPLEIVADGSVVMIPKRLVHREINPGAERNRMIVIRVGSGQAVFPVDMTSDS